MISQKVKQSFSKSAKSYEKHGTLQREVSRYLIHVFAPADIVSPVRMLDIGSGTGFTSIEAKKRWPASAITAMDIAQPMAAKTRNSGILHSATADWAELPYKNESFDLVISSLAFQWAHHNEKLFEETSRVLKRDGALVFSTLGPGTLEELHKAYDLACRECTGKPARFAEMPGQHELAQRMETAGFKDVVGVSQPACITYNSVELLFKTLKGIGATMPGRPDNHPRRDVLSKTVAIYSDFGKPVKATYELIYLKGVKG